jgi:EmrB/QacA subfamily drug resistance transporter
MTSPIASHPAPRRWLVLLAMTGSLAMIFLDVTVVGVALPKLRADLHLAAGLDAWVMNAYTLTMASLIALGGRFSDSFGRVRCFVLGVSIFAIASLLCAFASDAIGIVAARIGQGVGAALMQPSSSAIVISSFAPGERGKAMAVYVGIPMAFLALGPVIGGWLAQSISWRACFVINLPVAALALILTARAKPGGGPRLTSGFDPLGAVLYLGGLPAFVFALQQAGIWGWSEPRVFVPLALGFALVVAFVAREWKRERPLLAVRLFRERAFLGDALVLGCMQFAMTGQVIFMGTYLQGGLGFSPRDAGAALLPMLLPILIVVHVAGRLYDRLGVRVPVLVGTALACVGVGIEASIVRYAVERHSYVPVALGMALFGTGIGFAISPTNTDALSRVDAERRGQASGLLGTVRQVAASLGIAAIGAAVVATQRGAIQSDLFPALSGLLERGAQGDLDALASLSASPEGADAARLALAAGTAAGHWTACAAIGCAFIAAFILLPSGRSIRNEQAEVTS